MATPPSRLLAPPPKHDDKETTTIMLGIPTSSIRRKLRHVVVLLALIVIVFISITCTYVSVAAGTTSANLVPGIIHQSPLPVDPNPPHRQSDNRVAALNDELAKRPKPKPVAGSPSQPLVLSTEEELGAVVAYLTSPGANARIPSHIDPSKPLDAQIILGFNIRSPRARTEVEELVKETWSINPVVVFGESRQPRTKSLKRLLDSYDLLPSVVHIDVQERDDRAVLAPLIRRLTSIETFPILLVGGEPLGDLEKVLSMGEVGRLQRKLLSIGVKMHAGGRRKGGQR